jgi:hypothetical protein
MTSESQKLASQKYYAKVRETRLAQMRERNAKARALQAQADKENPEGWEERRARAVEKYYKGVIKRNKDKINEWLEDPRISATFKEFLRQNVIPVADKGLPKKFLDLCWNHLAIASNSAETLPAPVVDGT